MRSHAIRRTGWLVGFVVGLLAVTAVAAYAYYPFPHAHGPHTVKIGQRVTYTADIFASGDDISVTIQLGRAVGSNGAAVAIHHTWVANADGIVRATFRWPVHYFICSSSTQCTAYRWPRHAQAQVALCGSDTCAAEWVRIRR